MFNLHHKSDLLEIQRFSCALSEANAKLAAVSRSMAMIEFTPDGIILDANPAFLGVVNYRLEEIVGKHHRLFCSRSLSESLAYQQFWQRLRQGEHFSDRFPRLTQDGKEVWLEATYMPIRDDQGSVTKVMKIATDITRHFIRAKRPCADGYRWYLRRQEGASNYQALLDDLVREGRVEDACWMLDQFGPTNDVLEVDHLEADALVFAGSVRCRGHTDVEGVLRTGRSLSVLGGLRVGGALRVGEDLRVAGAVRCDGSARIHGDARVGWSLAVAQRLQCTGSLRVGGELEGGASVQIDGHCTVGQDLRVVGALDWGLDAQQATSLVNIGATNSATTNVDGANTALDLTGLIDGLKAKGHTVNNGAQSSGVSTIMRVNRNGQTKLEGGVDPRREGIVLGDGAL